MPVSKNHYYSLLKKIHRDTNKSIIIKTVDIITPHADEIATFFYNTMLENPKASYFITHDLVKKKLHPGLSKWIIETLSYKDTPQALEDYINYQLKIGYIHGRIDLPLRFVYYGMYLIKSETCKALKASALDKNELFNCLLLVNQIFDVGLALINESYQGHLVINEKDAQAFKLQFNTHNLAFDCERLRASLASWMKELVLAIQQERFDAKQTCTIQHSNFGLWVTHKAKLFLDILEYDALLHLLNNMDNSMQLLLASFDNLDERKQHLTDLDTAISKAMWILENIAKEIIDRDSGRDPLTRLFNRRYLDTVLRHETDCSLKHDLIFGVLMIDIDYFKKINDSYGHDNGDTILSQLADILTHQVRSGDFVFRLGGEEFLIVLSDINIKILENIGEKIRLLIEKNPFILKNEQTSSLTVSIGIAIHDGHPDFQRTLKAADAALYRAKNNGRNRVEIAPSIETSIYLPLELL